MMLSKINPSADVLLSRAILAALAAAALLLSIGPAAAIPSPELVVGSLSSLSQLGALLSALVGGGAVFAMGRDGKGARRSTVSLAVLSSLVVIAGALAALNVYQWQSARKERFERLSATLTRPARLPGQPKLDATLKELSLAEQAMHPLGVTPAEAETIASDPEAHGFEIIDIREAAEVEMGTFAKARAVRYPDFLASKPDLKGKTALLVCHNGNRSSETCQALKARGVDCRFIVGGLERWIVEGRKAGGFYRASVLESRAVPSYPNNDRLLDTTEARRLIMDEAAVIVDTRYPGEFAAGHLPGAVNIPMRRMTTPEVEAAFERLPQQRPVLVACYDRRSCFFGELAGLELWRKGRDFRGRYTLPWEYAPLVKPPAHVAAALKERDMSYWERARRWLAETLAALALQWGFIPVLGALAVASRLVILPFAVKAERDQIVAREIEKDLNALKARLVDDPVRRARAIRHLYRRHGLTPVRNLVAMLGLPILMLAGAAIGDAASLTGYSLGVFGPMSRPDPTYLMAVQAAVLIGLYVDWALCVTRRGRLAAWLGLVPGLALLMAHFPAATNLYVSISAGLLLAQRAVVVGLPRVLLALVRRWLIGRRQVDGIVRLTEAGARSDVGMKAGRLGLMIEAGMPVPRGVVLTPAFVARWGAAADGERRTLCATIQRAVGRGPYAVRSSGAAEDQSGASHAGVYESVTNVAPGGLAEAVDVVVASFGGGRARTYGTETADGAVIVQRMVAGRHGGVLFTRAPDAPGMALVEMVEGGAEDLVSGRGRPVTFRFGRRTGRSATEMSPPFDLSALVRLGQRLEARFGAAQDIEWVWDGRRLWLVQSRDITANATAMTPAELGEWERALAMADDGGDGTREVLTRNEMCEMLPRPTTATLSLIEALHASGGSVDLACRALGLSYEVEEDAPPLFPTLFGRLYHNSCEARRRAPKITRLDTRRICRTADGLERRLREDVLPALELRLSLLGATDFEQVPTEQLVHTIGAMAERFVTETHVEAEVVNIVAEVLVGEARRALKAAGQDAARWLVRIGETREEMALRLASLLPPREGVAALVSTLGHRSALDYELAAPRFSEDAAALDARLSAYRAAGGASPPRAADGDELPAAVAKAVAMAGRAQTLKEDVKHVALREVAVLRKALLVLDRRFGLDGRIFHLTLGEIATLAPGDEGIAVAVAVERERQRDVLAKMDALAGALSLASVEQASWPSMRAYRRTVAPGSALGGTRVAGSRRATGRAFVVDQATAEAGAALTDFETGNVLVAPFVHPAWLGEVFRASGVVAGSGGWLSHMAIVARERDVAMTVGVEGWSRIPNGVQVTLELDGSVRVKAQEAATPARSEEPVPADVTG